MATIKTTQKFYDYVLSIEQNLQSLIDILHQNRITISFNALSAETNPLPIHTFRGQSIGILPKISIPGYDLDGWYSSYTKDPNSGIQTWVNLVHDNDRITFTKNTTLYAKWKNRRVQITLDAGNGSCNYDMIYVPYLSFYGNWIDTPTGTVLSERRDLPTCVAPASVFLNWKNSSGTVISKDDQMILSDDFTLYANYDVQKYTLTYNLNGGSIYAGRENEFVASEHITYNTINHPLKQYGNNPPIYKTGFIFRGWAMSKNDINILNTITIFYNTKVFACWEPIQYTLKYGNASNAISVELKYNEVYDLIPFSETNISYSNFKCWKYVADNKTNYLFDEQLVCNLTKTNNATVILTPYNVDPPINSAIRVFLIPARKIIIDDINKLQRGMDNLMHLSIDNENQSSADVIYNVDLNEIGQAKERPIPELSAFFNSGDVFTLAGQFELGVEITNQEGEITTEILPEAMFESTLPFGTVLENKYPYIIYDDIQIKINILNSTGTVDLRIVVLPEFN